MNLFVNIANATGIHPQSDAVTLRWAYIFATRVITTPVASSRMYFTENVKKLSIRERVLLIRDHVPDGLADLMPQFEDAARGYDQLSKKKTRDKRELFLLRKVEDVINSFYKATIDNICQKIELSGMNVMGQLPKGGELTYYCSDVKEPELKGGFIPLSRVLQLRDEDSKDKAPDDVTFLLPMEFMRAQFKPAGICAADAPEALEEGAIWMERVMELPNINAFDALEVQVLRSQMQRCNRLQEAFRQWTIDAFTGAKNAGERLSNFRDKVRPAAAAWQGAARQCLLLRKAGAAAGGDVMEVWMGEMPMQVIWDFYHAAKSLTSATWEALSTKAAQDRGRTRVPVVALAVARDPGDDAEGEGTNGALTDFIPAPSRKRLLLD